MQTREAAQALPPPGRDRHPEVTNGPAGRTFYVYLNNGDIEEIGAMTAALLTDRELVVLLGEDQVAAFPKRDVYFAGYGNDCPGILF
jgi:hypothetical protein